jgi:hypothetical protein
MKDSYYRHFLTIIIFLSLMIVSTAALAGPIKTSDVKQVVNGNPYRQSTSGSIQLVVTTQDPKSLGKGDGDEPKKDDSRVITEEVIEITEEPCACESGVAAFVAHKGGFPWWSLGFAGAPLVFVRFKNDEPTPTPSGSPQVTPSGTPIGSPSPSPSVSPSTTPSISPTPSGTPPQTVPEPMAILLFGTGLSAIGYAARRAMRKRRNEEENEDVE